MTPQLRLDPETADELLRTLIAGLVLAGICASAEEPQGAHAISQAVELTDKLLSALCQSR